MLYILEIVVFFSGIILYARSASALQLAFKIAESEGVVLFNSEYKNAATAFMDFRLVSKLWKLDQSILTSSSRVNLLLGTASRRVQRGILLGVAGGLFFIGSNFYYVS